MRGLVLGALLLAVMLTPARGQSLSNDTLTAEKLAFICNPPASEDQAARDLAGNVCYFYFRGLTDGVFLMKNADDTGERLCLPAGAPPLKR